MTPPAEINQDLSPALESIILKAMAVEPQQRFQSMDELHAAITALGTLEGA